MKKGIDHIGTTVVFFCHDGKGNFILSKRSKNSRDEYGTWDPGGGAIEFDEPVMDALKREVKEEYCTDIIESEFLGFRDIHRTDEMGNKTHWIGLDFKVLVDREKVKNGVPDKHDEIGWFNVSHLPNPLHSQFPLFIKKYKGKI